MTDLKYLVCHLLDQNSAWLYANQQQSLSSSQIDQLNQWTDELKSGKPLAYIIGEKAFWNLTLKVNEFTLIPRPETELIIETVEQMGLHPTKILDLGTGSGAIALALATIFTQAQITATDVSIEALATAKDNAKLNKINHVTFYQSDWFGRISDSDFDLIVSNPPYLAADDNHLKDLSYEPLTALVAENNGLAAYETICAGAINHLSNNGILMFEHGWQQHHAVADIMKDAGFVDIQHRKDLLGHQRITWGILKT